MKSEHQLALTVVLCAALIASAVMLRDASITGLVTENATNQPPVWTFENATFVTPQDTPLVLNLSAFFADPEGQPLTFIATQELNLTIDLQIDILTITPDQGFVGERIMSVIASDGEATTTQYVKIVVSGTAETTTSSQTAPEPTAPTQQASTSTEPQSSGFGTQEFSTQALVNGCAEINESTSLSANVLAVISSTSTCMSIKASHVVFNCTGFSIAGNGTAGLAIRAENLTNVTIKDCTISNFSDINIRLERMTNSFVLNNTILFTTSNAGIGIRISNGTNFTVVANNTVNSTNNGMLLTFRSMSNTLMNNNFSSDTRQVIVVNQISSDNNLTNNIATSISNDGIAIAAGNNTLRNNTAFSSSGNGISVTATGNTFINNTGRSDSSTGLNMGSGSNDNTFINNSAIGASGIAFTQSSRSNFTMTTIKHNGSPTLTAAIRWSTFGENNSFSNTTIITNSTWLSDVTAGLGNNFTNTTFASGNGSILILPTFTFINRTVFQNKLNITFNQAFLNSTNLTFLNTSAVITLREITSTNPKPTVDFNDDGTFEDCASTICTEISFSGNVFVYNVTQFTTYSSADVPAITLANITSCPVTVNSSANIIQNIKSNGTCINVTASNAVINCSGFSITGNGSGTGIKLTGLNNVTINGCVITNFSTAVFVDPSNLTVENSTFENASIGLNVFNTTFSIIRHNIFRNNTVALLVNLSSNNNFTNNSFANNSISLFIQDSLTNTFNNTFAPPSVVLENTSSAGGMINYSQSINITNATLLSEVINITANRTFVNTTAAPAFNRSALITLRSITFSDPKVVADFEDDGTFTDCPASICTEVSFTNNVFVFNVTQFTTYSAAEAAITSCPITINSTTSLTQNIPVNTSGNCITIGANNIVLNCSGFSIGGNASGTGINASLVTNATIKDCLVENFSIGIALVATNFSSVTNNTARNHTSRGILVISNSRSNRLINNTGTSNPGIGIYLLFTSTNNTLIDNTGIGVNGISLDTDNDNNTLIQNNGSGTGDGIQLSNNKNNRLTGNVGRGAVNGIAFSFSASNTTLINNVFEGNGTAGRGVLLGSGAHNNTFVNTTLLTNVTWILVSTAPDNNITNTTFEQPNGSVRILPNISLPATATINLAKLNISSNKAFLNSTDLTFFNTTAEITLRNITFNDPRPTVDVEDDGTFANCASSICTELGYNATTQVFVYNVTQFTSYSSSDASPNISSCPITINESTTLTQNLSSNATCITINASNLELDCDRFTITYGIAGSGNGITGVNKRNITIRDCIVIDINASGAQGFGINFTGLNTSLIANNTITTNGTSSNNGIDLTSAQNTSIVNNTVRTFGSSATNDGLSIGGSENNMTGNTITTNGTSGSDGIIISGDNDRVTGNTIVNATHGIGIFIPGGNGHVVGNNSINSTVAGVRIEPSISSIFTNNITTSADGIIIAGSGPTLHNLSGNIITAFSTTGSARGIVIIGTKTTNITSNTIVTNGTEGSVGILLNASSDNFIFGNVISTNGTNNSHGISVLGSSNNTFIANNITAQGIQSFAIFINISNTSIFNRTILTDSAGWINSSVESLTNFSNITFEMPNGSINILPLLQMNGSQAVTKARLNISANNSFLNSTNLTFFNRSAIITLRSINFTNPKPIVDFNDDGAFEDCASTICTELSFSGNTFVYNVTQFTSYSSAETGGAGNITSCPVTINVSTNLTQNLTSNDTCITFGADNITLDCKGFSIFYNANGSDSESGVVAVGRKNVTVKNCVIRDINATGAFGIAINLTTTQNSSVVNNSIFTNGTNDNYGILVHLTSQRNNITNNTIRTEGSTSFNVGIYLLSSDTDNEIAANVIQTTGTSSNIGLFLSFSSSTNRIENNTITANGTSNSDGIRFDSSSNGNVVVNNTLTTDGSSSDNYGIELLASVANNRFVRNSVSAGGTTNSHGIRISSGSNNNTFENTNITTRATAAGGIGAAIVIIDSNSSLFNQTILTRPLSWMNTSANTLNNFTNTTFESTNGSINIPGLVQMNGSQDATNTKLNVSFNNAFLNSTNLTFLNVTGIITLRSLTFTDPFATVDFDDDGVFNACPSTICTELSFTGGVFVYNVSQFTSYSSSEGNPNITLVKISAPNPVIRSTQLNYTITVNNTDTTNASNITLTETYPNQTIFISSQPTAVAGTNNTFIIGNLSSGQFFLVNITVFVRNLSNGTVINNSVNISFTNLSNVLVNQSANTSTTVIFPTITSCPAVVNTSAFIVQNLLSNGSCLTLNATNILVQCFGTTITGNGSGIGIKINTNNVTLTGCTVTNFSTNLKADPIGLLIENSAFDNAVVGLELFATNDSIIRHNIFRNNSIALLLNTSLRNNFTNNTFTGNGVTISLQNVSENNSFVNTSISTNATWLFSSADSTFNNFTNTTFEGQNGSINILRNFSLPASANVSIQKLNITFNKAVLNSTNLGFLNTTGIIALRNLTFTDPFATVDFDDDGVFNTCPSTICTELSYTGGVFVYNTSQFTSYSSSEGNPNITVVKISAPDPVIRSTQLNYTITINNTDTANASNISLTETYPNQTIFISSQPPAVAGTNNTFIIGNLSSGQFFLVNITVHVRNLSNGTVINNTVNISFTNFSGVVVNQSANASTTVIFPTITSCPTVVNASSFIVQNLPSNGSCLTLNATNIAVTCFGTSITGNGTGTGIKINTNNVTVSGCTVTNFSTNLKADPIGLLIENSAFNNAAIGLELITTNDSQIRHNIFRNNTIAILLNSSLRNNVTNNTIRTSGIAISLQNVSENNSFVNTSISTNATWLFSSADSTFNNFTNTTFEGQNGSINILRNFTLPASANASIQKLNITFNKAFLNSTNLGFLNTSADITLRNLTFTDPFVTVDFNDDDVFDQCPASICTKLSFIGGALFFNVTRFTAFSSSEGNPNITLVKISAPNPVFISSLLNYTITINNTDTANASNITLTETYPNQTIFISSQPTAVAGTNNTFIIGNLSSGQFFLVNITVFVRNLSNGTIINNTVNISFTNFSGVIVNQTANASTTVIFPNISSCPATVNTSAFIVQNLQANGSCITLASPNIVVDCLGFSLGGNTTGIGINATDLRNITIRDCFVENFSNNIVLSRTNDSLVSNTTARNSSGPSIVFESSKNSLLANSTAQSATQAGINLTGGNNNTLTRNNGTSGSHSGILLDAQSSNNTLIGNRGTSTSADGVFLNSQSNNNTLVNTTGASSSLGGVRFSGSSNNTLMQTIGASDGQQSLRFDTASLNNTLSNTTLFTNTTWIFTDTTSEGNKIGNATFEGRNGSIRIVPEAIVPTTTTASLAKLNISFNNAFLNSTNLTFLNTTGIITLRSLTFTDPFAIFDLEDDGTFLTCSFCTELSYTGGVFVYNTSHFTSFSSSEGNPNITLVKISAPDPVIRSTQLNYTITINNTDTANASNITLTETYPNQTIFISSQPTALAGTNNTFIIGNLSSGQFFLVNITVHVRNLSNGTVINNSVNISFMNVTAQVNTTANASTTVVFPTITSCPAVVNTSAFIVQNLLSNGSCLTLNATNILVQCFGTSITGNGTGTGIKINTNNVTLTGCTVANFSTNLKADPIGLLIENSAFDNAVIGLELVTTNDSIIRHNVFRNTSIALLLNSSLRNNVSNNTVRTSGIAISLQNVSENNTFINTSISTNSTWLFSSADSTFNNFTNTTFEGQNGSINILRNFSLPASANISIQKLNITFNNAFLNSTNLGFLNTSAEITLRNLTFIDPFVTVDFNDDGVFDQCPASICTKLSFISGTLFFNVTRFTSFSSSEGNPNVTLVKISAPNPVIRSTQLNYTITINNTDTTNASNITLTETYPNQTIFISSQPTAVAGTNNTFIIGNLSSGQFFLVNITVFVRNLSNGTVINNSVNISFMNVTAQVNTTANASTTVIFPTITSCPAVINTSTFIVQNLLSNNSCLTLNATNILVQCFGTSITSNSSGTGIKINTNNVTLTGCTVANFSTNIKADPNALTIENSLLENATIGLDLFNTTNSTARNNVFRNTITALFLNSSSSNNLTNNTIASAGLGIDIEDASENNSFVNTSINANATWVFSSDDSTSNNFTNTTFEGENGSIRIAQNFSLPASANVSIQKLNITFNKAFLNSTNLTFLNTSADITLRNILPPDSTVLVNSLDGGASVPCLAPRCTVLSFSGNMMVFNVSSFTFYSTSGLNISLNKNDTPDPVNASTLLNYSVIINVTGGNASNISLTETYPNETIFISSQPPAVTGTNNTFIIGNLTAGQSLIVNISVLVRNITNGTVINNTVNVSFQNVTSALLSLNATENTTVLNPPLVNTSNLSVNKTDTADPVNASGNLTYVINVTSNGNATAFNTTVNDTYPSQVIFLTAQPTPLAGTNNTFILGNLTNGTTILINITVLVRNITNGTIINNTVNATFQNETNQTLSIIATQNTTVLNPPFFNTSNVSINKTDTPDPVIAGAQLNYNITIRSTGNATAFNVTVNDTYPSQVTFVSAQPSPASGTNNFFILGNLTPGTNITINITVSVSATTPDGTVINNTANVTFQNETSNLVSATASTSTTVSNPPVSGGSAGRGGGGGAAARRARTYLMTQDNQTFTLQREDKVVFNLGNVEHAITLQDIVPFHAVLSIEGTGQRLRLQQGATQVADVDGDGRPDVRLTVLTMTSLDIVLRIELLTATCLENWACEAWGPCADGKQTRLCADINRCRTTALQPGTQRACAPPVPVREQPAPLPPEERRTPEAQQPPSPEQPAGRVERMTAWLAGAKQTVASWFAQAREGISRVFRNGTLCTILPLAIDGALIMLAVLLLIELMLFGLTLRRKAVRVLMDCLLVAILALFIMQYVRCREFAVIQYVAFAVMALFIILTHIIEDLSSRHRARPQASKPATPLIIARPVADLDKARRADRQVGSVLDEFETALKGERERPVPQPKTPAKPTVPVEEPVKPVKQGVSKPVPKAKPAPKPMKPSRIVEKKDVAKVSKDLSRAYRRERETERTIARFKRALKKKR